MIPKLTNTKLNVVCDELTPSDNVNDLLFRMQLVMANGNGIGLAANQIGITKRLILIATPDFKQEFINPVITKRFGGTTTSKEGCLSFPGKTAVVIRHKRITVEGFDKDFNPIKRNLKGLNAICVQHEVDHINGVTCMDIAKRIY